MTSLFRARWPARKGVVALVAVSLVAAPLSATPSSAGTLAGPAVAGAAPLASTAEAGVTKVRNKRRVYRRGYRQGFRQGFRSGRHARPYRPYRPYRGRPYYRYDYGGAAVAAGIIGLAAGAIAGSALAAPPSRRIIIEEPRQVYPAPYTGEWYRLCAQKYRSFRASDGTFLGYDGHRHVCRIP